MANEFQCDILYQYALMWLVFRDRELVDEIIQHRETCPVCIGLRKATDEWRIRRVESTERVFDRRQAETAAIPANVY